jgi:hypothetical protein
MPFSDWDDELSSASEDSNTDIDLCNTSGDESIDEAQEDDPEAPEMERFVISDGKGERWGRKTFRAPEELEHLQTEQERLSIQESSK